MQPVTISSNEDTFLLEGPGLPRELQSASDLDSSRGPSGPVELDIIDYSWQDRAACSGMDINLFYLGRGKKISAEVVSTCESCPVNPECLQHALEREEYGYWANTNSKDRIKLRQELGIKLKPINYEMLERQDIALREEREALLPKIQGRGRKKKISVEMLASDELSTL